MNIKGQIVTFRAVTKDDMQMMLDMLNDPEVENPVIGWFFPQSLE